MGVKSVWLIEARSFERLAMRLKLAPAEFLGISGPKKDVSYGGGTTRSGGGECDFRRGDSLRMYGGGIGRSNEGPRLTKLYS